MSNEFIRVEDRPEARRIVIDRAAKRNALTSDMMQALVDAIAGTPAAQRMLILSAARDQVFCSGADIGELRSGEAAMERQEHGLNELAAALENAPVPTVCVVHGKVLGGAMLLPGLSDIVIARADTVFQLSEIEFGAYPGPVHAGLAPRLPAQTLYQLAVSGRALDAQTAATLGFVTEVLPAEGFGEAAQARSAWYARRAGGVRLGRLVRGLPLTGTLHERVAAVAAQSKAQIRSEEVRQLLAERFPAKPATAAGGGVRTAP